MSGPNSPRVQGPGDVGVGTSASGVVTNFSSIQALVEDEERLLSMLRSRNAGYEDQLSSSEILARKPIEGDGGPGQSRGPYLNNPSPFIITTESFAREGRYIIFWAGPSSVSWNFPMRTSQQQTRSGTILHTWRSSKRGTLFAEPEVTCSFQAGTIMPVRLRRKETEGGLTIAGEIAALPQGLFDFYEFFDLMDEKKILPDGRPNFVMINYHSLVYPDLFMRGLFTPNGITFTDNSSDPSNLTWNATFKVRSTAPQFNRSSQLVAAWRSALQGTATQILTP